MDYFLRNRRFAAVAAIVVTVLVAALSWIWISRTGHVGNLPVSPPDVVAASSQVKKVAAGNNVFACRILNDLARQTPGRNVFVSPYSIGNALTMTLNGAGGSTAAGIQSALGLDGTPLSEINAGNRILLPSLENPDPKVTVTVSNALWALSGKFSPDFQDRCRRYYDAEATSLNGDPAANAAAINNHVSETTHGKIDQIVKASDLSSSSAVLTDAIYFKGEWTHKFEKDETRNGPFRHEDGSTTSLPMMSQEAGLMYGATNELQIVSIPYGSGRFSLCILLPRAGQYLGGVINGLSADRWNGWMTGMKSTDVRLTLPRFQVDYTAELSQVLEDMGMKQAFDTTADFGPMGLPSSHISKVLHKALVQVDEEGTVATAATGVVMSEKAGAQPSAVIVRVDHPFMCAIRDDLTGTILFAGAIYSPEIR